MTFVAYMVYHVELMLEPLGTPFESVVDTLWWAFVTVTTVGYGDFVPMSNMGQFLAAAFMIIGALSISLFVISVVTKFIWLYENNIEMCALS